MTKLIRLENAALGMAAIITYFTLGGTWPFFLILILLPDISMLGYLANPRFGAYVYNAFHTWIIPAVLLTIGAFSDSLITIHVALIWAAHIGIDRAIGYGLKHETDFKDTHLGRIGKNNQSQNRPD